MILVIDIGNTSIKIAATDNYKIILTREQLRSISLMIVKVLLHNFRK